MEVDGEFPAPISGETLHALCLGRLFGLSFLCRLDIGHMDCFTDSLLSVRRLLVSLYLCCVHLVWLLLVLAALNNCRYFFGVA